MNRALLPRADSWANPIICLRHLGVGGEVRFDSGRRALYATDLSIYSQVPIGVVVPRDSEDVEATLESCRARGMPILGRGCGTSLSGQPCNVAVVLDFSKYMNRILALDPDGGRAHVEPGVINDQLRAAARRYGLTFSFGYERERYEVSMKIGEEVLLPAVRKAPKDALIIADGFSCRSQIEQGTGRKALHLAEVLQMGLREGRQGPPGDYPERGIRSFRLRCRRLRHLPAR